MKKCDYYGCKGKATREIHIKVNIADGDKAHDSYDSTLHVCEKCYKEYLEAINGD